MPPLYRRPSRRERRLLGWEGRESQPTEPTNYTRGADYIGRRYIRDNYTILTHGGSRAVEVLLTRATDSHGGDAPRRFKVIHVIDEARPKESDRAVSALRDRGVKVATIPISAVAFAMETVDRIIVGAEAVTSNAGIISRMGTYQIALVAKAYNKQLFVAAEQYKFGDTYPDRQSSLGFPGFKQNIINFQSSRTLEKSGPDSSRPPADPVDYTVRSFEQAFIVLRCALTRDTAASRIYYVVLH